MPGTDKLQHNYNSLLRLPIVKELQRKYKATKTQNQKLISLVITLSNETNELKRQLKKPVIDLSLDDDSEEESGNISYEFVKHPSIPKVKLEKDEYINRCTQCGTKTERRS